MRCKDKFSNVSLLCRCFQLSPDDFRYLHGFVLVDKTNVEVDYSENDRKMRVASYYAYSNSQIRQAVGVEHTIVLLRNRYSIVQV